MEIGALEIGALSQDGSEARFTAYVESLAAALGHADRVEPLKDYCNGLLMPGERKSVEPIAAELGFSDEAYFGRFFSNPPVWAAFPNRVGV